MLKELGITLPALPKSILKNRIYQTSVKEISGNRFDPVYHQIYFHQLIKAITKSKYKSRKLGEELSEINYGASFNNEYVENGVLLLRIKRF